MASKIVLITGGSRGLGRSMALHAAEKGIDVIITYHSQEGDANEVVELIEKQGRKAHALKLDASKVSSFSDFAGSLSSVLKQKWSRDRFDFLVNNAGTGGHSLFMETTEAKFDELLNIHFKGVYFLTQKLLPIMNDGGRIVNISSGLARFSHPGASAYAAMKGAVEVMTRYLAAELGPRGISVNTVAPGAIQTDFNGGMVRDNPEINKRVASMTALGRAGLPDDVGPVVASLLQDDMGWITAQRIEVSGGMHI